MPESGSHGSVRGVLSNGRPYRDHLGIRPIEKLRGLRLTRAAELVEAAVEETLSHYAFQTRNAPTTRVRVIDAGSDRMPLRPSGCGEPS